MSPSPSGPRLSRWNLPDPEQEWVRLNSHPRGPRAFSSQIAAKARNLRAGTQVAVLDKHGERLGWALYHPRSRVALRFLSRREQPVDEAWIRARATAAAERRLQDPELATVTDAYRVIHAEGDDLPGLIVDRYADVLVAELFTLGAESLFELALPELAAKLGTRHHRLSFDRRSAKAEAETAFDRRSPDCPTRVQIREHDLRFEIDFDGGHKTGFFCDQRDNRRQLGRLCTDKTVLDLCCYTGGFAVAASAAGAKEVLAVDLDEVAIESAKRNANLNQQRIRFVHADAFSYMRTLQQNGRQFDVVVLDPPKFIPSRKEQERGMARYHDLNKLAMPLVAPGGCLLSCSCSGLLPHAEFLNILRGAARTAKCIARVIRQSGPGIDHPVRLDFPEGHYLKAVWMRIDRP